MGFMDFVKKSAKKYSESQKPENVNKRLRQKIRTMKLREELDSIQEKRRKRQNQKWNNIKIGY